MCQLPAGWVRVKIADIALPIEKVLPLQDEKFTYLDISSIDNELNRIVDPKIYYGKDAPSRARQRVKAGDILFSTVRTYLKNIATVPAIYDNQIASTGFCVLRSAPEIDNQYLFYFTLTKPFLSALAELQRGTSYPAVRDSDVREQLIPLAPLAEQQRIVAAIETHFTRLDAAVAALKRVQANLRRYRASVLKAACEGRLVPTEADLARAAGREYEPAAALLARILAARRAQWAQEHPGKPYREPAAADVTDLPELPEGWAWATLDALAKVQTGLAKGKKLGSQHIISVPYLRVANVQDGFLDLAEIKTIEIIATEIERYSLKAGDILFNEGGDRDKLGRGAIWSGEIDNCIHQNHVFAVRLYSSKVDPKWVNFVRQLTYARDYFWRLASQTTNLASINSTNLRGLPIPIPPQDEQNRIIIEVERCLSIIDAQERAVAASLARAERLRQSILQRAFSGQLVAQDPRDEPAAALLERIRGSRNAQAGRSTKSRAPAARAS